MAKEKKPRLLDTIKAMPTASGSQKPSWHNRLKDRQPELYSELCEVVRDYNEGGSTFEVFRSISAMHSFLLDADTRRTGPKMLNGISRCMFARFIEFLRVNPNG